MSHLKYLVPDVYYDVDIRGRSDVFDIDKEDDTVYIDGILVQSGNDKGYILYLTCRNGEYVTHREDGPACIGDDGESWFIHDGVNYAIEQFPVDELTKMMWLLKYQLKEVECYVTYHGVR